MSFHFSIFQETKTSESIDPFWPKVADRSWQKIGADVTTLDGTNCLCVVDNYSNYFEVDKLKSKTEEGIAKKLRRQFQSMESPIN